MRERRPPRSARVLLHLWPLGARRAEIEADLAELWDSRVCARGERYARRRYYGDVISLWRSARLVRNGEPRSLWQPSLLSEAARDLTFGTRLVRRNPAAIIVAVVGLGVAIGVGTAMFSLLNAMVLKPVGIVEPDSVVRVFRRFHGGLSTSWPYAEFAGVRDAVTNIRLEASSAETVSFSTTADSDLDETIYPMFVTGGFLATLNSQVTVGRLLLPADDEVGAPPVVVLAHAFWRRRLGADPSIVERSIWLNGAPFTVIGVSVRGFTGTTDTAPSLWAPLSTYHIALGGPLVERADGATVHVVGRIVPGVLRAEVEASLGATAAAVGARMPNPARERLSGVRFLASALGSRRAGSVAVNARAIRFNQHGDDLPPRRKPLHRLSPRHATRLLFHSRAARA